MRKKTLDIFVNMTVGKMSDGIICLACLFRRKSRAIMIARSSLLCKNLAQFSKSIKGIDTKLGIFAYHDKVQLQDKGHNS